VTPRLERAILAAAAAALENADNLNHMDAQAGDGDLGVTMTTAARAVSELLPSLDGQPPADVLRACGAVVARKAPSTCGTLMATGLLRAAQIVGNPGSDGAAGLARSLEAALAGIGQRGGAEFGAKTMLDALGPAAEAATEEALQGRTLEEALIAAARAADEGARATAAMEPRHGRAGWLAERSAGHEDGGARLIAILLAAAAASLNPAGSST